MDPTAHPDKTMRKRDVFPAIFLLIAALLAAVLCGIKLAMGDTVYAATQAVIALFLTATALLLLRNAALLAVLRERTALSEAWNAVTKANTDVALRAAESTAKAAAAAELYTDAIKDQIKARETLAQTNRRLAELN